MNRCNVIGAVAVVFAIGVLSVQAQPAAPACPSRPARIIAGFSPGPQERLLRNGAEPVGNTPEEIRACVEADLVKWAKVIDAAGIGFEP